MRRFRAALAGLLLLAASHLTAQCCEPSVCCGDFEVGVHALLFQPLVCRYDFGRRVDEANGDAFSTVATIDPSHDWGFRVWGKYIQDCMFVSAGYQWYEARDCARLVGDQNVIMRNSFSDLPGNEVTGRLFWRYQNVDVRIGGIKRSCKGEMYGFVNARWVDLEYSRRNDLFGIDFDLLGIGTFSGIEKAQFDGGAVGLGFGSRRNIWCDVGIFGELNLLGVIGSHTTDADFFFVLDDDGLILTQSRRLSYRSVTTISPEFDFRVGLDYTWYCDCWTIVGEIGYELDYFWNAFDFPDALTIEVTSSDDQWITSCQDVGFSGLFFGLRALF